MTEMTEMHTRAEVVAVEPEPPEVRRSMVGIAAAGLLICMNGPSVTLSLHYLDGPINWEYWAFLYPFTAVAVAGCVLLARELAQRGWGRVPWPMFPIAAYATWSLASSAWSVAPFVTPTRALVGIGILSFGCWLGCALWFREQLFAIVLATSIAVIASALMVVKRPGMAKMATGDWRGIFANRNSLAPVCVLSLVALVGLLLELRRPLLVLVAAPIAALDVWLMRGAASDTAAITLALTMVACLLVPGVWLIRRAGVPGAVAAVGGLVACWGAWVFTFAHLGRLTELVGKDDNLSSRRVIWAEMRNAISLRPWRGYGFWAYWDNPGLVASTYARIGTPYGSAHNSVLEVGLGLGFIGLALYLVIAAAAVSGVFRWVWDQRSVASWWWSILVVFLVAENLTESFVLWHSYNWVLFIAGALVWFGPTATTARMLRLNEGTTNVT